MEVMPPYETALSIRQKKHWRKCLGSLGHPAWMAVTADTHLGLACLACLACRKCYTMEGPGQWPVTLSVLHPASSRAGGKAAPFVCLSRSCMAEPELNPGRACSDQGSRILIEQSKTDR